MRMEPQSGAINGIVAQLDRNETEWDRIEMGRDFLRDYRMVYDGETGRVTLSREY